MSKLLAAFQNSFNGLVEVYQPLHAQEAQPYHYRRLFDHLSELLMILEQGCDLEKTSSEVTFSFKALGELYVLQEKAEFCLRMLAERQDYGSASPCRVLRNAFGAMQTSFSRLLGYLQEVIEEKEQIHE